MKLRIRSLETKETIRIEIPDSSSLPHLKTLIAGKLSSSSSSPIPPESITFSLNRTDQLVSPSLNYSLQSLGLTSGDLLFYSETQTVTQTANSQTKNETNPSPIPPIEEMEVDSEMGNPLTERPSSIMVFFRRVLDLEKDEVRGNLGFVVLAVHAVFLESGFVVFDGDGSRLPKHWNLATSGISIQYTVVDLLLGEIPEIDARIARVKFSLMGNNVSVYGFLGGDDSCVYRLCLDLSMVMPLIIYLSDSMSEDEEKGLFDFWNTVKKELSLPLLIDICQKNGLPPPPCCSQMPANNEKPSSIPYFLKRAMELEKDEIKGNLGFLVVAVHAVFLESGFLVCNRDRSQLPKYWNLETPTISIQYTVPDLLGQILERDVKVATLKFSMMRNLVSIYGFLNEGSPEVYRLCLDLSKVVPLLVYWSDSLREEEEKEVSEFWKTVKDKLTLPLLIDICEKNGLPPPPCFARLPTDLKAKILEFLPGDDVARIACTGSEMWYLTLNDELWKQKFMEEFAMSSISAVTIGTSWKEKYQHKKNTTKLLSSQVDNRFGYKRRYMPRYPPFVPRRFPFVGGFVGGDYHRFPAIGNLGPMGPGLGLRARQNFSPHLRLGGYHGSLIG